MATNSRLENFKKILDIIDAELKKEGNEPLYEELRRRYGSFDIPSHEPSKIDKIEQYLGLDYKLDSVSDIFDYDFVKDYNPELFDQLTSDYREMMRYRHGTRSHKTDFGEFCKYAHFQLEAITNYFYNVLEEGDINNVIDFIKGNNEYFKPEDKTYTNVEDIPYIYKMNAVCYCDKMKISKNVLLYIEGRKFIYRVVDILYNISQIRNRYSHRGSATDKDDEILCDFELNKEKIPVNKYGTYELPDGFKSIRMIKWRKYQDWDTCLKAMHIYINAIKESIE